MIIVLGKIHAQEGQEEGVSAAGSRSVVKTQGEPGLLEYSFYRDTADPRGFIFVEIWESPEALAEHGKSPHLAEFRAAAMPLLDDLDVRLYNSDLRSSRTL